MAYTYKTWKSSDYYNFSVEFNRIESYNEYCKSWLKNYGYDIDFTSITNWTIDDIIDIKHFNRVKGNINTLLDKLQVSTSKLNISTAYNQSFDYSIANELENKLKEYLNAIGEMQFSVQVCGNAICGNETRIVG